MRESKALDWADFERFTVLAAEIDADTARQAQGLKRDLSVKSGFSDDPWTRKPRRQPS